MSGWGSREKAATVAIRSMKGPVDFWNLIPVINPSYMTILTQLHKFDVIAVGALIFRLCRFANVGAESHSTDRALESICKAF